MNTDQTLYIRALLWASEKGSNGFALSDLKAAVTKTEAEWSWVKRMLTGEINGDPPLIFHLGNTDLHTYYLTGSGAAAILDYLELKEARQSSRNATYWAIAALSVAILTGLGQIISTLYPDQSRNAIKGILGIVNCLL